MTASPSAQTPPVFLVLPVVTNGFMPSLAIPPTPHIAPPKVPALVAAAHAVTRLDYLSARLRASHDRHSHLSCSQIQHKECCPRCPAPVVAVGSPAVKLIPLYEADASTSTGQPGLMSPVSTLRERIRCFLVVPPSGVVIVSRKSAREGRSTIGVPMMPIGSNLGLQRSAAETGGPRCVAR